MILGKVSNISLDLNKINTTQFYLEFNRKNCYLKKLKKLLNSANYDTDPLDNFSSKEKLKIKLRKQEKALFEKKIVCISHISSGLYPN